ncbi:MAG: hypothetical protein HY074_18240 [Deltaproteobacteria bacterium]|nr:hypothetical protein [Deltaproteobacteria bacterium]
MSINWPKICPLLFTLAGVYSGVALAAPIPGGHEVLLASETHNGDYLKHVETPPPLPTLNTMMFSKGMSSEGYLRYNTIYNANEERHNYGLVNMEDQIRYKDANRSLTDWTMHRLLDDNFRTPVRRFVVKSVKDTMHRDDAGDRPDSKIISSSPASDSANSPTGTDTGTATVKTPESHSLSIREVYGTVETFYNNGLKLDKDTLMRFQYDVPGGVMDLAFKGSIVDTSFDYYVMPLNFSATGGGFGGNTANPDRAAVTVSKSLNDLGLSTGMHYGLMTRSLNYGMSKHLLGPLSAGVNQAHNGLDSSKDETTYRLNLGIVF